MTAEETMAPGTTYDAVVLGVGSGGQYVANELAGRGWRVAAVHAGLVGGECPYRACVPSKALLAAAAEVRRGDPSREQRRSAWAHAVAGRRKAAEDLDDSDDAQALTDAGAVLLRGRGEARADREVVVRADDGSEQVVRWTRALVLGTGSSPTFPPVDGLDDVPTWTSEDALTDDTLPERLLVLGGGPVGCELSQVYASFGVQVYLVETAASLLPGEDGWVGDTLAEHLRRDGVDVRPSTTVVHARPGPDGGALVRVESEEDGDAGGTKEVAVDRVLVVTGRSPSGEAAGAAHLGADLEAGPQPGAIVVDERCRMLDADGAVVDGVFAVGDVTGISPYTHTANHHARVVLARLPHDPADPDVEQPPHHARTRHEGIPRVVYTEPPVFSVGLSLDAAKEAGAQVRHAEMDVVDTARAFLAGTTGPGRLRLVVDAADGRLLGAAAVAPQADSWGGELALAVTARLQATMLAGHVRAFPTWSEAITPAALELADRPGG